MVLLEAHLYLVHGLVREKCQGSLQYKTRCCIHHKNNPIAFLQLKSTMTFFLNLKIVTEVLILVFSYAMSWSGKRPHCFLANLSVKMQDVTFFWPLALLLFWAHGFHRTVMAWAVWLLLVQTLRMCGLALRASSGTGKGIFLHCSGLFSFSNWWLICLSPTQQHRVGFMLHLWLMLICNVFSTSGSVL